MLQKIGYWLTHNMQTGEKYHTLAHCLANDKTWTGLYIAVSCLVVVLYLWFAVLVWRQGRDYRHTKIFISIMSLALVFLFCCLCGYLGNVVKISYPAYKAIILLHVPLIAFTFILVNTYSKQQILRDTFRNIEELQKQIRESYNKVDPLEDAIRAVLTSRLPRDEKQLMLSAYERRVKAAAVQAAKE